MTALLSNTLEVLHHSDVGEARRAAKALAESIGFDPTAREEIALVMTELATNLIKHAQGGKLLLTALAEGSRAGLQIESQDTGPGIADFERAMGDRFSTVGSRGTGLGAVNRMMDELDFAPGPDRRLRILCRKWVRQYAPSVRACPLAFGVATRPRRPGTENGDAFILKQWAESALLGIIDGLGHGPFAHHAAQAARQYVESHFDRPLDQIFRGTARVCRATRGVVMALARFDWGEERLRVASVGNIAVRALPHTEAFRFLMRRGVLGLDAPKAAVTEHAWAPENVLVLHSDGLVTHWCWKDFPEAATQAAPALANELLRRLGRDEDDATVMVAKGVSAWTSRS